MLSIFYTSGRKNARIVPVHAAATPTLPVDDRREGCDRVARL